MLKTVPWGVGISFLLALPAGACAPGHLRPLQRLLRLARTFVRSWADAGMPGPERL